MKIVHYTNIFYSPSHTFIVDTIRNSINKGHTVTVVTQLKKKDLSGVDIVDFGLSTFNVYFRKSYNRICSFFGISQNLNYLKGKNVIHRIEPDLIHCHFGTSAFYCHSLLKYCKAEIPLLISLHGYDVFHSEILLPGYKESFKEIVRDRNAIFSVPSNFLKDMAVIKLGIPKDRLRVVYNSFNSELFFSSVRKLECAENTIRISNIGRFVNLKGQRYLIEALQLLKRGGLSNIEVDFIGNGEELETCKALADSLDVLDMCKFHGTISHTEIPKIVGESHIYVHTSISLDNGQAEAFGISILEAVAMGKPVIYFKNGGIPEIFNLNQSKYYVGVESMDIVKLKEEIANMIPMIIDLDVCDIIEAKEIVVKKFSESLQIDHIEKIYLELVNS